MAGPGRRWQTQVDESTVDTPYLWRGLAKVKTVYTLNIMLPAAQPCPGVTCASGVGWSTVAQVPAAGRVYIGSPSIVVLPDGAWLASNDLFGPGCRNDTTWVHRSEDQGASWSRVAELRGQWWSTLFLHQGAPHLLGTTTEYGDAVIRRSLDGGRTWSVPADAGCGLLRRGRFHGAPQPVLVHRGRLWRAMESFDPDGGWPRGFAAGMMSAPLDADLLRADSWTWSSFLPSQPWLDGRCNGWLEGNAVADAAGGVRILLRVDLPAGSPEVAANVAVSDDGRELAFDPATGFIPFPGAAKKFCVRRDPAGAGWWSIATDPHVPGDCMPGAVRNRLSLLWSGDLARWQVRATLLFHPDRHRHGFQYVDWQFLGDDLLAACRTAGEDGRGGAANFHDANLLTVHRIAGFRRLGV